MTDTFGDTAGSLSFAVQGKPAHGKLEVDAASVIFAPDLNWFGEDRAELTVSTGEASKTVAVSIHVAPVNDRPRVTVAPLAVTEDTEAFGRLTGTTSKATGGIFVDAVNDNDANNGEYWAPVRSTSIPGCGTAPTRMISKDLSAQAATSAHSKSSNRLR